MSIYEVEIKTLDGKTTNLEVYRNKVLLIVNTATQCGLTPQYKDLEELQQKYEDLVVLDFPCNQFGHQAPGTIAEINQFCELNYQTTFPRFDKVDVNGKETAPIYKYLKKHAPFTISKSIKWNFTKFLITKEGQVIKRYAPTTKVSEIEFDLKKYLNN